MKKVDEINQLHDEGKITTDQRDKAIQLEKSHSPWIWKKNDSDKIVGIVDIFASQQKERNNKGKRRKS